MNHFADQYGWLQRRYANHVRALHQLDAGMQLAADQADSAMFACLMKQAGGDFRELGRILELMDWCDPQAKKPRPAHIGTLRTWIATVIAKCDRPAEMPMYALEDLRHAA